MAGSGTAGGYVRVETGAKRVRALLGGRVVADTTRPVLVWEVPYYPTYYIPIEHVRAELVPTGRTRHSGRLGEGRLYTVRAGGSEAPDAALRYQASGVPDPDAPDAPDAPDVPDVPDGSGVPDLGDLVRLEWGAMDAWLEEDEQVYTHPRSPYTRIDILDSSRQVRIEVDGVTVADSTHQRVLFETGLPPRFYLPKPDVRLDLLEPTDSVTHCPYKGQAHYWSVRAGDTPRRDLAWSYPTPLPESQKIAGLVAFYDEKVDVYVDGVRQQRPQTPFS